MEARYKQPSSEALNAFLKELKDKKDIPQEIRFFVLNILKPLKEAKSPDADKLCVAGLIWLAESEKPLISVALLNQGLGISATNNLDDKQKIIYLAKLAEHAQAEDAQSKKESKDFGFKDQVTSVASHLLDRIPFKKTPKKIIDDFKDISNRYREAKKNESFLKRMWGSAPERSDQEKFIETLGNLIADLSKMDQIFDYEALILAASIYIMFQIEGSSSRRLGGGQLYPLLQKQTKLNHTSEIDPDAQKLLFDEFFKFIKTTTIDQWEKSRPLDAKNFNVYHFVFNLMYNDLPKIKLKQNGPCSIPYVVASTVGTAVTYAISYTQEFALFKFAEDLYLVQGIGKNSIILTLAAQIGESLSAYAGYIGGYFIKQSVIAIGQAAEKRAVTFSLTGMFRVTMGYLSSSNSSEPSAPVIYDPNSDPFESLINLAFLHAKKENDTVNVDFFAAVLSVYKMLPSEIKNRLNERTHQKSVSVIPDKSKPEELKGVKCAM